MSEKPKGLPPIDVSTLGVSGDTGVLSSMTCAHWVAGAILLMLVGIAIFALVDKNPFAPHLQTPTVPLVLITRAAPQTPETAATRTPAAALPIITRGTSRPAPTSSPANAGAVLSAIAPTQTK